MAGGKIILNEDSHGTIQLKGVTLHHPKSADELLEMLLKGNNERTQSSTAANSESSRSHAIFQIYLRGRPKVTGTTATWKHSKFSLIDLAGGCKLTLVTLLILIASMLYIVGLIHLAGGRKLTFFSTDRVYYGGTH